MLSKGGFNMDHGILAFLVGGGVLMVIIGTGFIIYKIVKD